MKVRDCLQISPEVVEALRQRRAVVSLGTTMLAHVFGARAAGFARQAEQAVREAGAVPAWTAVWDGVLCVGLSATQRDGLCGAQSVRKLSRRDLPIAAAMRLTGATTASAAMVLSSLAGIHVLATGGVGGVHRCGGGADVSADLQELRQTPVAAVCSGTKQVPDIGPTLEYLETIGVPVLGLRTDEFPAFFCRGSGFSVDYNVQSEADAARIARAKWDLGLRGGVLVANLVPADDALDLGEITAAYRRALDEAQAQGVRGGALTPFLLERVAQLTQGRALDSYIALALNNARAAGRIAAEYARL